MSICTPYSGLRQTSFDRTGNNVSSTTPEDNSSDSGNDEAERTCARDDVASPPKDTPVGRSPREATERVDSRVTALVAGLTTSDGVFIGNRRGLRGDASPTVLEVG
jgi:hypothetical protein